MSVLDAPTADVAAYAADVRRALAGLTPEQVDDLTDDLEQTLADALSDDHRSGAGLGLVGMFGPATTYADELRTAAGLEDGPTRRRSVAARVGGLRRSALGGAARVGAQPWWPGFSALVRSVAPAWWVLRGWVIYIIVQEFFIESGSADPLAHDLGGWALLFAFILVSVQWGRGLWRRGRFMTVFFWFISVWAAILLGPLLAQAHRDALSGAEGNSQPIVQPADGVYVDGRPVSNLFVYDADGNPVTGAQVFDDQGRPVATTTDSTGYWNDEQDGSTVQLVPATAADGSQRLNAYPLRTQEFNYDDPDAAGAVVDPLWPFAKAGAIVVAPPGPTAEDAGTTPDATASAAPASTDAPNPAPPG